MNMNDAFLGSLIFGKNSGGETFSAPLAPNPNANEIEVVTADVPIEGE